MRITGKPQLLSNDEAADFLGISPGTLVVWRSTKRYTVPFLKVGRKVLYDVDDLVAWLESCKVRVESVQ
jgi:excisionase family DNA binding protein